MSSRLIRPGEVEAGDAARSEGGGQPGDEALADAGLVGDEVGDVPVLEPGEEAWLGWRGWNSAP